MGLNQEDIAFLAATWGKKKVNKQTAMLSPFYAKKLPKIEKRGRRGFITISGGGMKGVKWIRDGGTLPRGGNKKPEQGHFDPKILFGRVEIGRAAVEYAIDVDDGVDIVMHDLDTAAENMAHRRGGAYLRETLGNPAAIVALGATTFTTRNPTVFRQGDEVEVRTQAGVYKETVELKKAKPALGGGVATITLVAATTTAWATTDVLYAPGAYADAPVSLRKLCADEDVYTLDRNVMDYTGNLDDEEGDITLGRVRDMLTLCTQRREMRPSCMVGNSVMRQRVADFGLAARRWGSGETNDAVGGTDVEVDGVKFSVEEHCADIDLFLPQLEDMHVHIFTGEHADKDGMEKGKLSVSAGIVGANEFVWDFQFWSGEELACDRRNGSGHITNCTG